MTRAATTSRPSSGSSSTMSTATPRRSRSPATTSSISASSACRSSRPPALMTDLLEKGGFKVERGISGFPTGFCATYGSGDPVVAIHTEYDSCPDNSQVSGVAEPKFIVEGAPGHCEGHNVNAAVLVATALAAKQAMDKFGLKGTLKVFGGAGRGAARQPAVFRARRLVRRRRSRLPQPHRRRVQRHPRPAAIGADLGDLHLPRRDRAFRRRALEGPRRARRRGADGRRHGAIPRAHAAGDARASRHHQWRRPAQRDPAHRGGVVVLPRPDRGRRDEAVRAGEEDRAGRGADEQHRGDGRRAERGVAAALQPHALRAAPAPHRAGRHAGMERGGGGAGARAAGQGQGQGRGAQARGPAAERLEDAAHLGQRRRRHLVEGADGEVLLSVQRAQHHISTTGPAA